MNKRYLDRIPPISGFEEDVCKKICEDYTLGEFISYKLIETGYEDFNFILETTKKKYFVKIFSKKRKNGEAQRIVELMNRLIQNNIKHPILFKNKDNESLYSIKIRTYSILLCVMNFIEGSSFFDLNEIPNEEEIKILARETPKINSLELKENISPIYDSWAIINFQKEYIKKKKYLDKNEKKLIEPIFLEFDNKSIDSLPKSLVHGDIIRENNKALGIIDFSVANIYPRIIDIAVIVTHILFDRTSQERTKQNTALFIKEYEKSVTLTREEKEQLPKFILFSYAIEYLNTLYEMKEKNNLSRENLEHPDDAKMGLTWAFSDTL